MAEKPKPGFSALRRYAKSEGLDLDAEAKKQGGLYAALLRHFRSQVAELKDLGVLPPEIDARRALPTSQIGRVRNEFFDVLADKAKTKKVAPKAAKNLKEQGYTVRRGRVIVRKDETVRRNEVVKESSPENKSNQYAIKRLNLKRHPDKTIDTDYLEKHASAFMAGLTKYDYVAVDVYGNYGEIFNGEDVEGLIQYLVQNYGSRKNPIAYIRRIYVGGRAEARTVLQAKEDKQIASRKAYEARKKRQQRARRKSR
jgi:hypothetical protein